MKKITVSGFVALFILLVLSLPITASNKPVKVLVAGRPVAFSVQPYMSGNRQVMVPAKDIFKAFGAVSGYDSVNKKVYGRHFGLEVDFVLDDWELSVNGEKTDADSPAVMVNNQVMIPLKVTAEAFGRVYYWDNRTYTANIVERPAANIRVLQKTMYAKADESLRMSNLRVLPGGNLFFITIKPIEDYHKIDKYVLYFVDTTAGKLVQLGTLSPKATEMAPRASVLPDGRVIVALERGYNLGDRGVNRETFFYLVDPKKKTVNEYLNLKAGLDYTHVSGKGDVLWDPYTGAGSTEPNDLFKSELDGKSSRLTNNPDVGEEGPVWSPDSSKIAFRAIPFKGDGDRTICVIKADGSSYASIKEPGHTHGLSWSPDGRYLAYSISEDRYKSSIWVMKADGSSNKKLCSFNDSYSSVAWSPDGTKLTATADGWFVVLSREGKVLSKQRGYDLIWSPDSRLLLYKKFREFWVWDPQEDKDRPVWVLSNPVWTADSRIIYSGYEVLRGALIENLSSIKPPAQQKQSSAKPGVNKPGAGKPGISARYSDEQKRWVLATNAMVSNKDNLEFDPENGAYRSKRFAESVKDNLFEWWDVTDRADALDTIKWLKQGGHRAEYNTDAAVISKLSDEEFNKRMKAGDLSEEEARVMKFVRTHYKDIGNKSLLGWDFSRVVNVASTSYIAGYLTLDEAWEAMIPAAQTMQKTFSSWEELGKNYVLGCEYWAPINYEERAEQVEWLLSSPQSPWLKLRWDLPLNPQIKVVR